MNNESYQAVCEAAINTAHHFRLGYEGEANAQLVRLIDDVIVTAESLTVEEQLELQKLCESIFISQQRSDFILIADILEYQLTKLF